MDKRFFVAEENWKRLDVFLAAQMEDFTRSRIKKLVDDGKVTLNGQPLKAGAEVKAGSGIAVEIPDAVAYDVKPENIPVDIVYEDQDVAVVNKPQGMTVHIGNGNAEGTLVNALLYRLDSLSGIGGVLRPGIVHRIDKDTSGLLVVAKNDVAHVSLAEQIAEKTCRRVYLALLEGKVKEERGRVATNIGRSLTDRLKMAVLPLGQGKSAITDYEVLTRYGSEFTLCRFTLQTGRTHQIRVHAKYLGNPVVGDPVYGVKKQKFNLNGQLLHARELQFKHPKTGEEMRFFAPIPDYFEKVLETLDKKYGVRREYPSEEE